MNPAQEASFRKLISAWFEANGQGSVLGVPNTGLIVLEALRNQYPLSSNDVLTTGSGQVRRLSGRNAIGIIRRFRPDAPAIGTESGRTSRGTPQAATDLAERLNALANTEPLLATDSSLRGEAAEFMQRWIVENPIADYYDRQRLKPDLDLQQSAKANVAAIIDAARPRAGQAGAVAQHLVGAKLALRFPGTQVSNNSYSSADVQTGRRGDFDLRDAVVHVTIAPMQAVIDKCSDDLKNSYRPVLLVSEEMIGTATGMLTIAEIADAVDVYSIETFVSQNLQELAEFDRARYRVALRELLEKYNERVRKAEPDRSLLIDLPANL
jgi:uncharacterized protein DUF4928